MKAGRTFGDWRFHIKPSFSRVSIRAIIEPPTFLLAPTSRLCLSPDLQRRQLRAVKRFAVLFCSAPLL
jgi:hypothetical protein